MKQQRRNLDAELPLNVILPAQFYDRGLNSIQDEGIRRLFTAILEDAVRTFQSAGSIRGATRSKLAALREAEGWIYNTSVGSPFSYCNVCEFLGLDPDALRRGLGAWRRRCQIGGIVEKLPRLTSVRVETRLKLQRIR
jgi:hypothetical protein